MSSRRLLTVTFLVTGLCLVLGGCAKSAGGKWQDGAYQGKAPGLHGDVAVTVTVEKGRIARVAVDQQEETAGVADTALTRIPEAIVKAQSTKVDAVTGASVTSKAIMAAVDDALTKAAKQ